MPYTVTIRVGPKITRSRHDALGDAIDSLEVQLTTLGPAARRETRKALTREYAPGGPGLRARRAVRAVAAAPERARRRRRARRRLDRGLPGQGAARADRARARRAPVRCPASYAGGVSVATGRLTQQTADEWIPVVMEYIAVIDRSAADLTAMFGWTWAQGEEEGLGPMSYVGLAYDGRSRYALIASDTAPRARRRARGAAAREPGAGARRLPRRARPRARRLPLDPRGRALVRALGRLQAVPGARRALSSEACPPSCRVWCAGVRSLV